MKTEIPETMLSVRQNAPGEKLVIEEIPVPLPGPGEVLIRMAASPVNPSDLSFISGSYGVPDSFPFTPGFEGSGTVLKAGKGFLAHMRIGKRVACSNNPGGDGTWAEYMVTSAMRCISLSKKINMEQGAMLLVNPMTAMALIDIAIEEKHRGIVNNAAASALGKMLVILCKNNNIPLINIVRREEQENSLRQLGAKYVLNSEQAGFKETLKELANQINATLLLDAIGGEAGSTLIETAPEKSKIIVYAKLSGEKISFDSRSLLRENKIVEGFQLGNFLKQKSLIQKLKMIGKVRRFLETQQETIIQQTFPLPEINDAITLYKNNMSKGKVLIKP